jgi:FAD/FMN-containing dehydrogenase
MNGALRKSLMASLGPRYSEIRSGAVVSPANERELAQVLSLLAASGESFGPRLTLSRRAFSQLSAVEGKSATLTAGAGARLSAVETQANAHDLSLGPLPPGAEDLSVADYLEGGYAGLRVTLGGRLEPLALSVRAMLADGTVFTSHRSPRSAAGPDLKALFAGSGGQLGLTLEATLRLVPRCAHGLGLGFRFANAREATRTLIETTAAGVSLDWAWADSLEGGEVALWLRLCAPSEAALGRDRTLVLKLFQRSGAQNLPDNGGHSRSDEPERELGWDQVEAALAAGGPLRLYRIAMESVVVQGAREQGLPIAQADRWTLPAEGAALRAAIDPQGVLGGGGGGRAG